MELICGVDEAGRGPLAGPVFAAAVILDPLNIIAGIKDSKKLSVKKREDLSKEIKQKAKVWAVAEASVEEIDRLNILQATLLAMSRAISKLTVTPTKILIDGNQCPKNLLIPCEAVIKGDDKFAEIAAASILAKVARDARMLELHQDFPEYGFKQHQGYGTKAHLDALSRFGASPIHRRSFAPVRNSG